MATENNNLQDTLLQIQTLEDFHQSKGSECGELIEYIKVIEEYVYTTKTDIHGIITDVSNSFCRLSGYTKEELIGKRHSIIRDPDTPTDIFSDMWEIISNRGTWSGELSNRKKNGELFWMQTIIFPKVDKEKNIIGYSSIRQNITSGKRLENEVIRDHLTGLYNRRYYDEIIERELMRAKRDKQEITFAMIDVDFFKLYNDTYGHRNGDTALKSVAQTISSHLKRGSDYVFRMGGEEFAVLFTEINLEGSKMVLERIRNAIEDLKIEHSKSEVSSYLTASFGMISVNMGGDIIDENGLYTLADGALYKAKREGRNQIAVHQKNELELF